MNKKLFACILAALLMLLLLAACERPASVAPAGNPTATGEIPFPPVPVKPTISAQDVQTQTAAAKSPPPVAATPTKPAGAAAPTAKPPVVAQPTAAPTKPPVVTPKLERPDTYTIQSGDHYICIARRYNLDLGTFLDLNGLSLNTQAVIGKVVKVPQSGNWDTTANGPRALKKHPDTHTVQEGESLNRIACSYGDVDPAAILAANNLKQAGDIRAGQTLDIP